VPAIHAHDAPRLAQDDLDRARVLAALGRGRQSLREGRGDDLVEPHDRALALDTTFWQTATTSPAFTPTRAASIASPSSMARSSPGWIMGRPGIG